MTDHRDPPYVEENVRRLIESALGAGARLRPEARRQALARVCAEVRARRTAVSFPDTVIALLGGLLTCALAGLLLLAASGQVSLPGGNPALHLLSVVLALNLILVPVSGTIIIVRRQREEKH
ncbi:MAG TPA: hypothetical protein VLC95_13965 [Anaerolineae bacterium]|nr:hypothetical protein [Anaerolineae bacterium]